MTAVLMLPSPPTFQKDAQTCTPKRIARQKRQDEFIQALLTQKATSFEQICTQFNISRRTGYYWFERWKQREGFYVDVTWWQLVEEVRKRSPEKALEALTRLKYRMTTEKREEKISITEKKIDVTILARYQSAIEQASDRNLQSVRAKQQVDTPDSQTAAT